MRRGIDESGVAGQALCPSEGPRHAERWLHGERLKGMVPVWVMGGDY